MIFNFSKILYLFSLYTLSHVCPAPLLADISLEELSRALDSWEYLEERNPGRKLKFWVF